MVTTEGIAVDDEGTPVDLTIRSFGVTTARGFPHVDVEVLDADVAAASPSAPRCSPPTLAAVWLAEGAGPTWPTRR